MEPLITNHASDVVSILIWVLLAGGGAFFMLLKWNGNRLFEELKGIKEQIQMTNTTLATIEKDLRQDMSSLDRRITAIEVRCDQRHKGE